MQIKTYKSPLKKLVHFFESSRDNWKSKCFEKNIELKRAKNQINDLKNRKENWKERAKRAEDELKEINNKSLDDTIKKNSLNRQKLNINQ